MKSLISSPTQTSAAALQYGYCFSVRDRIPQPVAEWKADILADSCVKKGPRMVFMGGLRDTAASAELAYGASFPVCVVIGWISNPTPREQSQGVSALEAKERGESP